MSRKNWTNFVIPKGPRWERPIKVLIRGQLQVQAREQVCSWRLPCSSDGIITASYLITGYPLPLTESTEALSFRAKPR
jgi:hypothetical protein